MYLFGFYHFEIAAFGHVIHTNTRNFASAHREAFLGYARASMPVGLRKHTHAATTHVFDVYFFNFVFNYIYT